MKQLQQYYSPHLFIETNRFLINRYNYKGKYAYAFIDKRNYKTYISFFEWKKGFRGGIANNLDGGLMFFPMNYFVENEFEYLAAVINPYELKAHVASEAFKTFTPKYLEKKRELEKLANRLKEDDNPVLMLVKLKE